MSLPGGPSTELCKHVPQELKPYEPRDLFPGNKPEQERNILWWKHEVELLGSLEKERSHDCYVVQDHWKEGSAECCREFWPLIEEESWKRHLSNPLNEQWLSTGFPYRGKRWGVGEEMRSSQQEPESTQVCSSPVAQGGMKCATSVLSWDEWPLANFLPSGFTMLLQTHLKGRVRNWTHSPVSTPIYTQSHRLGNSGPKRGGGGDGKEGNGIQLQAPLCAAGSRQRLETAVNESPGQVLENSCLPHKESACEGHCVYYTVIFTFVVFWASLRCSIIAQKPTRGWFFILFPRSSNKLFQS